MKLSDAILLGSANIKPSYRSFGNDDGTGCAITMAASAMGKTLSLPGHNTERVLEYCLPWLHVPSAVEWPCGCRTISGTPCCAIIHLFDNHVNPEAKGDWTLEQLVDYVRSIEPAEEPQGYVGEDGGWVPEDDEISDVRPELEVYKGKL